MINYKTVYILVLLIPFFSCKRHDEPKSIETEISIRMDEKKIDRAIIKLYDGIINRDPSHLGQVTSDNLSYGHSSGTIQTKAEFIDDVINGPFRFQSISYDDNSIVISRDMAIVRHIFRADATNGGQPLKIHIGVMMVFQINEEGNIVLVSRQAYKL